VPGASAGSRRWFAEPAIRYDVVEKPIVGHENDPAIRARDGRLVQPFAIVFTPWWWSQASRFRCATGSTSRSCRAANAPACCLRSERDEVMPVLPSEGSHDARLSIEALDLDHHPVARAEDL
jgi:hypothetical protein